MDMDAETLRFYCGKLIEVNGSWKGRCELVSAERGHVIVRTTVSAGDSNMYHNAFGGFLMSATDLVGSCTAASLGKYVVTQTADTHFIRPVPEGQQIDVEATVYHEGRTSCIVEVRIERAGTGADEHDVFLFSTMTMHYVGDVTDDDPLIRQLREA